MLSADDMGIRLGLVPFFCCHCGERLGWCDEGAGDNLALNYCKDCSKLTQEEIDEH